MRHFFFRSRDILTYLLYPPNNFKSSLLWCNIQTLRSPAEHPQILNLSVFLEVKPVKNYLLQNKYSAVENRRNQIYLIMYMLFMHQLMKALRIWKVNNHNSSAAHDTLHLYNFSMRTSIAWWINAAQYFTSVVSKHPALWCRTTMLS